MVPELADYFRIPVRDARARVEELVEGGELTPVQVEGWPGVAYLDPAARLPRALSLRTVVSPFDSLVWERSRTERLFGFRYRIEIYTPAGNRRHGYYVLPFLLGDRLVARVDLKSDRKRSTLVVPGAFVETGADPTTVAAELGAELRRLASWLGLQEVEVGRRGDLAAMLQRALRPARGRAI